VKQAVDEIAQDLKRKGDCELEKKTLQIQLIGAMHRSSEDNHEIARCSQINQDINKNNQLLIDLTIAIQEGITHLSQVNKEFGKKERKKNISIIIFSFFLEKKMKNFQ
jgi:hypothetical protein